MKNIKKVIISTLLVSSLVSSISFAAMAEPKTDNTGFSPIKAYQEQQSKANDQITTRRAVEEILTIPGSNGTLTVNSWIEDRGSKNGQAVSWDYLVSSVYKGTRTVKSIRTSWQVQASLRNGASLSIGFGVDSVSAGSGSSWSSVKSPVKYYENTNGSVGAYMPSKSNFVISPASDYRDRTATVFNTGKVTLQGVPGSHEYSAAATPRYY